MTNKDLFKAILESIYQFGPLSIPEINFLFNNYINWIFKLDIETLLELKNYDITREIKELKEKGKIREYKCESGYNRRYGISKLPFPTNYPLKLELKIKLKKCPKCLAWTVKYHNKLKHIYSFFCKDRQTKDDSELKLIRFDQKFFIIYERLLLGIFDDGNLRFPFRDFSANQPELFLAIDIINKKLNDNNKIKLKMNYKEVLI